MLAPMPFSEDKMNVLRDNYMRAARAYQTYLQELSDRLSEGIPPSADARAEEQRLLNELHDARDEFRRALLLP
jgi:hypothetical protein